MVEGSWGAAERRVLAHASGPLLVLGGAGTGKTSLLIELLARATASARPALALCLTRQAASDVRDRVVRQLGETTRQPSAMTLHAFCLQVMSRFGSDAAGAPALLTAPEQEFRIRELLAGLPHGEWPESIAAALGTRSFARQVRGAVSRVRQLGLDPGDVAAAGRMADEPSWAALGGFFDHYLDVTDAEGVVDYAELVHRTRILLERDDVADAVRRSCGVVFVDEFAEFDPAQHALVRSLVGQAGDMVAFADPDTAIYRFRGAHPRPLAEFSRLFGGEVVTLVDGRRCPAPLSDAVARVARRLSLVGADADTVRAYRAPKPPAAHGQVDCWTFPTETVQAKSIAAELRAEHLDGGRPWEQMAVLVRAGRQQIPALARALTESGIPVEVAGDEIGLADELAVRPLLLALEVVARPGPCDADEATRLLSSGWGGLDAVHLRTLGRLLRGAASSFGEATAGKTSGDMIAEALTGEPPWFDALSDDEAPEALSVLLARRTILAEARAAVDAQRRPDEVLWALWNPVDWGQRLRNAVLTASSSAASADHDLDAVVALFELARVSTAPGGAAGVRAFLAEVGAQQIPADYERESAVRGRGVRVLTAHRAKGRQWPFVVVAGVQEGVWPDVRRRGSLFDPQRLSTAGLGPGVETRDLVATERRLFLLAATRASERLLVTAVSGTDGEADQPSRFLAELGEPVHHVTQPQRRLHTLRALVASLRAASVDTTASPELRRAAAVRLARLASEIDEGGRPLVPNADPGRWWGMREWTNLEAGRGDGPITMTPSQLTSLLSCPRQYFLSREVKADPPRSSSAVLGSVIHALAQHALTEQLSTESALGYLDDVWADLPFPAPWFSLSERAAAQQAVVRFMGWQEAHDFAEVVGVELPFSVEIDVDGEPMRLRGTVDRLERDAHGRLRVVDFKSSRTLPTQAEAGASEQLGVYQLAIEAGAFAEHGGESAGGELVYLRHGDDDSPKVFTQPSLRERPHLGDDPDEACQPSWVHHRLSQARRVLVEGRFHATPGGQCRWCAFSSSCPTGPGQVLR